MLFKFPSKFVYYEKIENHYEIKNKILPLIMEDIKMEYIKKKNRVGIEWDCNLVTSYYSRKKFFHEDEFVKNIVWTPLDNMLEKVMSEMPIQTPIYSSLHRIWYSHYEKNDYLQIHDHMGCSFSGIYLLDIDEDNRTIFHEPGCDHYFTHTYDTSHVSEGNVILFPSSLLHYVKKCLKPRTTISFNVNTEFYV